MRMYCRPSWVSGKYNSDHHVAIVYNLLDGRDFFFEEDSADVVGVILLFGRNRLFSEEELSHQTDITVGSIHPFLSELEEYHLLTDHIYSKAETDTYRHSVRRDRLSMINKKIIIDEDDEKSDAENTYFSRVQNESNIIFATFELTYRCSARCIHCYNFGATRNSQEVSGRGSLEELSLEDYKSIIDELCELGLTMANLTGGDPFANKYVWDIIEYLYEKDVATTIMTNGITIANETEHLAQYYPKNVQLSLYSDREEIHDYITQIPGSWAKTMKAISGLSDLSIPVAIACCVMKPNIKSYRGVKRIAEEYGAEIRYDTNVTDSVEGDICPTKNLRLSSKQLYLVLQDEDIPFHINSNDSRTLEGKIRDSDGPVCRGGCSVFNITPDGRLTACPGFPIVYGNTRTETITSIILNSTPIKEWRHASIEKYEDCGKHAYCPYCVLCPGNNYIQHHTYLKAGENNCFRAKIRHKLIKEVLEEGKRTLSSEELENLINTIPEYKIKKLHRIIRQQ